MNSVKRLTAILALILASCWLAASALAETYEYDTAGRLTKVVYDDKSSLAYTYDHMGNILEVKVEFNLGKGDVNGDGVIDLKDAILVLKNLAGESGGLSPVARFADIDGDGKLSIKEVLYILQNME